MADFKTINDFRKGTVLRKINEDPTYLSFFFMFDNVDKEESPLLAGPAQEYLENVIRADIGKTYSQNLQNFQKVLFKINKELPWFWQNLTGLEGALTLGGMQEPWYGAENNRLEIECLEENVELTAIGLMDLYKRATYDLSRWVEIIPANLRRFRMYVFVTEVRKFQESTNDANLGIGDNPEVLDNSSRAKPKTLKAINQNFTLDAKPFIQLKFSHCEFDPDSIAAMFADLSKNPELKKPKIAITYGSVEQINQKLGANLVTEPEPSISLDFVPTPDKYNTSPFDPKDFVQGKLDSAVQGAKDAALAKFDNLKDGLLGGNNSEIGNAYGKSTGALTSSLLDRAEESILSKLFLGNVHGAGALGTIQDAIRTGSVNSIGNLVTDLFGGFGQNNNTQTGSISPGRIHPEGVDSSADGSINDNVYPPVVDSSPDGNISPQKVYDDIPPESNSPINDNAHE